MARGSTTITRTRNIRPQSAQLFQQIAAQDKAGERILAECARRRNLKLPSGYEVLLYKNNTDFAGHSYVAMTIT